MGCWICVLTVLVAVSVIEWAGRVSAGRTSPASAGRTLEQMEEMEEIEESNPLPYRPAQPAWPVAKCKAEEIVSQSDERRILSKDLPSPYSTEWPNTIAICAIMKDESAQDVQEFLEYHRWIGVDSFFIRENGEECSVREILQPYERSGVLDFDLAPGPKYPLQTNWYNTCARLAAKKHSWVAFIDLDEFIVVLNEQKSVTEQGSLKRILRRSFRYIAGVSMQWVLFGSSGHKDPPVEGQLQGFHKCAGNLTRQMKCLGQSYWFHNTATFRPKHVHQCNYRCGGIVAMGNSDPVSMRHVGLKAGNKITSGMSYVAHLDPLDHPPYSQLTDEFQIVLNHYVTRSQNKFIERKINLSGRGVYAETYNRILRNASVDADADDLYAQFEKEFDLDGEYPMCRQAAPVAAAMKAAMAAGEWSAVPKEPGLLMSAGARGTFRTV